MTTRADRYREAARTGNLNELKRWMTTTMTRIKENEECEEEEEEGSDSCAMPMDDVNEIMIDGHTILHVACEAGMYESVRFLVEEMGASLELLTLDHHHHHHHHHQQTCLHLACQSDSVPLVRYLIEDQKMDVTVRDQKGQTILHHLSPNGQVGNYLVPLVCGGGGNSNSSRDIADVNGKKVPSLDINVIDEDGNTPLLTLMNRELNDEIPELFWTLVNHPDVDLYAPTTMSDKSGLTALHHLLKKDDSWYDAVVHVVKERNADLLSKGGNCSAPIHHVFESDALDNPKIIAFLQKEVSDLTQIRKVFMGNNETPLHWMSSDNVMCRINYLVEKLGVNLDMSVQDDNGWTPLHCAVICAPRRPCTGLLERMVFEFGADPKLASSPSDGNLTALDLLCVSLTQLIVAGDTDDFFSRFEHIIRFLMTQHGEALSPDTARRVWNCYRPLSTYRLPYESVVPRDVWPLRMSWMEQHCHEVYGIAPEESRMYPVHSLIRCMPYLLLPMTSTYVAQDHDYQIMDRNKELLHMDLVDIEAWKSEDGRGFVPLQLYLHQRQKETTCRPGQQKEQSDTLVILDLWVLRKLAEMDTRISSVFRICHDEKDDERTNTPVVINPFRTVIQVSIEPPKLNCEEEEETSEEDDDADRVLQDLIYRLVRSQPDSMKAFVVSESKMMITSGADH